MGSYIVKPQQDVDQYIVMLSIPDAPLMWGSRKWLEKMARKTKDGKHYLGKQIKDRLNRADQMSCDSRVLQFRWDIDEEIGWLGLGWINRSDLPFVIQLLELGVDPGNELILAFVHLFEKDDRSGLDEDLADFEAPAKKLEEEMTIVKVADSLFLNPTDEQKELLVKLEKEGFFDATKGESE